MNKKFLIILAIIVVAGAGIFLYMNKKQGSGSPAADEQAVRSVVAEFGSRLKNVSLLAPDAAAQIRTQYGDLVSADLLAAFEAEPIKAPGRLTSSPWPDHIEILQVEREDDGAYAVYGKIIEATSDNNLANQYTISMKLRNQGGKWIITGFVKAIPEGV